MPEDNQGTDSDSSQDYSLSRRAAIQGLTGLGLAGFFESSLSGSGSAGTSGISEENYKWKKAIKTRFVNYAFENQTLKDEYRMTNTPVDQLNRVTSLDYVDVSWNSFGNPDPDTGDLGCWRHTFQLTDLYLNTQLKSIRENSIWRLLGAGGKPTRDNAWGTPAYKENDTDNLAQSEFELMDPQNSVVGTFDPTVSAKVSDETGSDALAVSARRDLDLFGLAAGEEFEKTFEQPLSTPATRDTNDLKYSLSNTVTPIEKVINNDIDTTNFIPLYLPLVDSYTGDYETFANIISNSDSSTMPRMNYHEYSKAIDHTDENLWVGSGITDWTVSTAVTLGAGLSLTTPQTMVVEFALSLALSYLKTQNNEEKIPYYQGFKHKFSNEGPVAATYLLFDIFVSPDTEPGSVEIAVEDQVFGAKRGFNLAFDKSPPAPDTGDSSLHPAELYTAYPENLSLENDLPITGTSPDGLWVDETTEPVLTSINLDPQITSGEIQAGETATFTASFDIDGNAIVRTSSPEWKLYRRDSFADEYTSDNIVQTASKFEWETDPLETGFYKLEFSITNPDTGEAVTTETKFTVQISDIDLSADLSISGSEFEAGSKVSLEAINVDVPKDTEFFWDVYKPGDEASPSRTLKSKSTAMDVSSPGEWQVELRLYSASLTGVEINEVVGSVTFDVTPTTAEYDISVKPIPSIAGQTFELDASKYVENENVSLLSWSVNSRPKVPDGSDTTYEQELTDLEAMNGPDNPTYVVNAPFPGSYSVSLEVLGDNFATIDKTAKSVDVVESESVTAIDDFEDNDLSEYSGDTSLFRTQSSLVANGSYALQHDLGGGDQGGIVSMNGLTQYPQAGQNFKYRVFLDGVQEHVTWFGAQKASSPPNNTYAARLDNANGDFALQVRSSDQLSTIASESVSIPETEWLTVHVGWSSDGNLSAELRSATGKSLAAITGSNTEFSSGGVGFWASDITSGSNAYVDIIEIADNGPGVGVIDDFEDGEISEYSKFDDTGSFSVQTGTVHDGTQALQGNVTTASPPNDYIYSSSGLHRYPQAGDTFEFWVRGEPTNSSSTIPAVLFGGNDQSDCYCYWIRPADDIIRLDVVSGGNRTLLASRSVSLSASTWYRGVVEWGDGGLITCRVFDGDGTELANISANDSTYSGGGFGWQNDGGGYWDSAKITASGDETQYQVIDDFEDGDVSEYSENIQTGSLRFDGNSAKGTNGLRFEGVGGSGPTANHIHSTEGLPRYPQAGDTFAFHVLFSNVGDDAYYFNFGTQSNSGNSSGSDAYRIGLDTRLADEFSFDVDGTRLAETSVTVPEQEMVEVVVGWESDGSFTVTLYNSKGNQLSQITASDATYSNGGIRIFADSNVTSNIDTDYYRIEPNSYTPSSS